MKIDARSGKRLRDVRDFCHKLTLTASTAPGLKELDGRLLSLVYRQITHTAGGRAKLMAWLAEQQEPQRRPKGKRATAWVAVMQVKRRRFMDLRTLGKTATECLMRSDSITAPSDRAGRRIVKVELNEVTR